MWENCSAMILIKYGHEITSCRPGLIFPQHSIWAHFKGNLCDRLFVMAKKMGQAEDLFYRILG